MLMNDREYRRMLVQSRFSYRTGILSKIPSTISPTMLPNDVKIKR